MTWGVTITLTNTLAARGGRRACCSRGFVAEAQKPYQSARQAASGGAHHAEGKSSGGRANAQPPPPLPGGHRRHPPADGCRQPRFVGRLPAGRRLLAAHNTCLLQSTPYLQAFNVLQADPTVRLHAAVTSGDAPSVAACLAAGAAADHPVQGCTALFRACKLGHAQCARLLLAAGGNPNWKAADGATALHAAASGRSPGHSECAALLLTAGADACATDRSLWLPLHTASHHGNAATVQLLLAAAPHTVLAQHGGGLTPLHQAAFSGRAAAVHVLLAAAPEAALMRWVLQGADAAR